MLAHISKVASLAAVSLLTAYAVSEAAQLKVNSGEILVSRGGGYVASGDTDLNVGDSVMANPGGTATITFAAGCEVKVNAGDMYVVPETPPCGGTTADGGMGGATPYIIGAVAIGGAAALIAAAGGGSDSSSSGGGGGGGGNGGGGGGGNGGGGGGDPASP